ncbi:hypothetical protein PRUPE_1G234700, partial [Prunus persica]
TYDCNNLEKEHSILVTQLNKGKKDVYDCVIKTVEEKISGLFFVHGQVVASSGIASLLLPGGRTAHSRFKIPIIVNNCSTCQIKKGTHLAKLIEKAALIVWGEAPMNHKHCFEALDKSLSDILSHINPLDNNVPFHGKPLLLGGDFRQILLVIPGGTREEIIDASLNTLKIGMPIMLLRNLNQSSGLCNGTRLVITQLCDKVIEAKILAGSNIGHKVFIPRISLTATKNK